MPRAPNASGRCQQRLKMTLVLAQCLSVSDRTREGVSQALLQEWP